MKALSPAQTLWTEGSWSALLPMNLDRCRRRSIAQRLRSAGTLADTNHHRDWLYAPSSVIAERCLLRVSGAKALSARWVKAMCRPHFAHLAMRASLKSASLSAP